MSVAVAIHSPFYWWLYLYLRFLILEHWECVALVGWRQMLCAGFQPLLRLLLNRRERQERTALGLGGLHSQKINSNRTLLYIEIFYLRIRT